MFPQGSVAAGGGIVVSLVLDFVVAVMLLVVVVVAVVVVVVVVEQLYHVSTSKHLLTSAPGLSAHPSIFVPNAVNCKTCNPLYCEYSHDATIIGKRLTYDELWSLYGVHVQEAQLGAVTIAIIIALILACIIATVVLVNQPAVYKLLVTTASAVEQIPWLVPLALGAGILSLLVIPLMLVRK